MSASATWVLQQEVNRLRRENEVVAASAALVPEPEEEGQDQHFSL